MRQLDLTPSALEPAAPAADKQPVRPAVPTRQEPLDDEGRLRFERLIGDIAARFVNIPQDEVDGAIVECQRRMVLALDLDRSSLFQLTDTDDLYYTHSWTRPEFDTPITPVSAVQAFPWFIRQIRAGETVRVTSVDHVPRPDRDLLTRYGTKATVAIPLMVAGQLLGILTFASIRQERGWPPALVDRLHLVGSVFAQALSRRRSHQELQSALLEVQRLRDLLARDNDVLYREVRSLRGTEPIAAESEAVRQIMKRVDQVAPTTATVLILGETGTGKEVFAQAIHDRSPRHKRPMVRVNCGAIPTALVESELFGREKGAYTGAISRQLGRFELAEGSTVFLDEVGELPLETQVKLLRVVQDRVVERLGSAQPIKVDVRVIAATNRNLEEAVAARTFREDLFYRLNVFPIKVPPLRERAEDIPGLVWAFVEEFSKSFGKSVTSIPREDMEALQRYSWPGNIRELRNLIEYAMIVAEGPRLSLNAPAPRVLSQQKSLTLADVEAAHIRSVLDSTGWRVRGAGGAAQLLGMKPTTLEGRMAKLGVRRAGR